MTLIYYDSSYPKEHIPKLKQIFVEKFGSDVLIIPKEFTVLQNASKAQLITAKNTIECALALQENN